MKLEDAIFNWLSMKVLVKKCPEDRAAIETEKLFMEILEKDFQVSVIHVREDDSSMKVDAIVANKGCQFQFLKEQVYLLSYQLDRLNMNCVTTNHRPTVGGG